jgi:hypothetical protein
MHKTLIAMAIAGACAAAPAFAMTKDEYNSNKDQISQAYKLDKAKCDSLAGNAKDVCQVQAKGQEKIARAQLDADYRPTSKSRTDAAIARADAAYDTAKEKCDDFAGNPKDVCVQDAKAAHVRAVADAKANRKTAEAMNTADGKVADARASANKEAREADYKAARERCDALAGDAKDKCVADAKARFAM